MTPQLIIFCTHPGLIRGGCKHPEVAVHDPAVFAEGQIREMIAEPSLKLAFGVLIDPLNVEAHLDILSLPVEQGLPGEQTDRPETGAPSEAVIDPAQPETHEPSIADKRRAKRTR